MLFQKKIEPKIKKLIVRVGNQINLGSYNLWKQDLTAEVEIEEGDATATIRATQIMLCRSLISKTVAELVCDKTKESFR
jgi:hypothetical protein